MDTADVVVPAGGEGEEPRMKCPECHKIEFIVARAKSDLAVAARKAARNDCPYNLRQVIMRKDDVIKARARLDDHLSWCG